MKKRIEGKTEDKKQKTIEVVRKMLSKEMDIKDIFEITGLSTEEVENIT